MYSGTIQEKSNSRPPLCCWIPVGERLPTHPYSVVVWVTGGRLHHGDDYLEIADYDPATGKWIAFAGPDMDDDVIEVSHWMDVPWHPNRPVRTEPHAHVFRGDGTNECAECGKDVEDAIHTTRKKGPKR